MVRSSNLQKLKRFSKASAEECGIGQILMLRDSEEKDPSGDIAQMPRSDHDFEYNLVHRGCFRAALKAWFMSFSRK